MKQDSQGNTDNPRILIVGGVAGGASCATRARRLSEKANIIIFERGPFVSFANCGLPYHVGNVIPNEADLLVTTPELFRTRFNIDVRVQNDVLLIDRENKEVEVRNLITGEIYREGYDTLVLSPGAMPVRPPVPGIDLPGIFTLRTIPDSREIRNWIDDKQVKRAIVVGGGFIGLEMAENLTKRGISVGIVEMLPQVMPVFDPEMIVSVHDHLVEKGVSLHLGDAVAGFEPGNNGNGITVRTASGQGHDCDMVILAIGVRPDTTLAREAGLDIGERGGIRVDEQMRTSDRNIRAVGDAVEVRDIITGDWTLLALAGPANRQGRIAADTIFGRNSIFRGVQGTSVCQVFDMEVASTGVSEKILQRSGINGTAAHYEKIYLHTDDHVDYYPGAKGMTMKLLFSVPDGRVLGAQVVGEGGAARRIDVLSMAIQKGATVFDLEEAELCYAPQFGAAKDPVNMAGMVAANALREDAPLIHWDEINTDRSTVLDVRRPDEFAESHVSGAVNIPLDTLRGRLNEIPAGGEIVPYCTVGYRSYFATRILRLNGFNVRNASGGITSHNIRRRLNPE